MKFKIWETERDIFERKGLRIVFKLRFALWLEAIIAFVAQFEKPLQTRRFDFGMPFGQEGRMRVVPVLSILLVSRHKLSRFLEKVAPLKSTRLSKLRMQSVLANSQASDRRSGMTDFKDQVVLQLEEFKRKYMRSGFKNWCRYMIGSLISPITSQHQFRNLYEWKEINYEKKTAWPEHEVWTTLKYLYW